MWVIVKRVAARAGVRLHGKHAGGNPVALDKSGQNVSKVKPHVLRKTYGSDLLNRGVPVKVVSKLLGHAHSRVTEEAYAELLAEIEAREALLAAEAGPNGLSAAVDGFADGAAAIREIRKADPDEAVRRIDALIKSLGGMKSAIRRAA